MIARLQVPDAARPDAPPAGVDIADESGASALAPPVAPLGNIAAGGFAWNVALTVVNKLIGLVATILFARLLFPDDFGPYYEALITLSLVSAVRDNGLGPVLIARQKRLDDWESAAFWYSLALGVVAGLVLLGAGAHFYYGVRSPVVARLLWTAAAASPLISAGMVSSAKLQIGYRFALLAQVGALVSVVATAATLVMAVLGWGAYSLMIPPVVLAIARSAVFVVVAPPAVRWRVEWSRGRSLAGASSLIAFSVLGWQIVGQSDTFIVSVYFDSATVGLYGWAFNLSIQFITVLAMSIGSVLLPTLATLNDEPRRQVQAYLRLCRVLAAVGVPFCVMQGFFAWPVVRPLFGAKWAGTEILIAVLSVGMAFAVANSFAGYVLQARQRTRLLTGWTVACVVAIAIFVGVGVRLGGVVGVAAAVSAYHVVIGSIGMMVVTYPYGSARDVSRLFTPPLLASAVAILPLLGFPLWGSRVYYGQASLPLTLIVVAGHAALFLGLYALVLRRVGPEAYGELAERFASVHRRLRRLIG